MAFSSNEKFILDNQFGAVTNRQVICFVNKNWLSRGSREYLLLENIVTVRYKNERPILLILFLILLFSLLKLPLVGVLLGILPLWGTPTITILTNNRKTRWLQGFPWEKKEAEAFSDALCKQLLFTQKGSHNLPTPETAPISRDKTNQQIKEQPKVLPIEPKFPASEPSHPQKKPKHRLLLAAKENQGMLSLAQAALATELEHDELKTLLEECVQRGYAEIVTNPESGKISYHFDL